MLLHFKRFIVTQEIRSSNDNKENSDAAPVLEMVLKKNKVRLALYEFILVVAVVFHLTPSLHCLIIGEDQLGGVTLNKCIF